MEGFDRLLEELAVWDADERAADAARSRSRERSLRTQLEEAATFVGALVDLAEAATPVTVQTERGRVHRGVLGVVGADFVLLRDGDAHLTAVALAAVASVRPNAPAKAATGARPGGSITFVQFLARCAESRPRVRLVAAGEPVNGELLTVGENVVTVRGDGETPIAYVPAGSVSECSLG